jgi:hypothetical protein
MVPALVLGGPSVTTLGVLRCLGRRGIPRFVAGTRGTFVSRSRWHRSLPAGCAGLETPASLPALLDAVPTDAWVSAVAALDAGRAARFPSSQAPLETLEILLDKARLAVTLGRLGVPHPRTIEIDPDRTMELPDWALRSGFLKPRSSQLFAERFGAKASRFRSRAHAAELVAEAARSGIGLVLQEYIPGPPTRHYMVEGFVDRTGSVRGRLARQRLRMYPSDFGDSVWMVTVPLAAAEPAVRTLDRLFAALRYRGPFEAEFKHDERDGQFKLLEINSRPWVFVAFAARCGLDVCAMAYRDALGLPVAPATDYEVGRHCVQPFLEWGLVREGRLSPWAWGRSLLGATQLVLRVDDPAPAVADLLAWLRRRLAAGR